jgi:hypothetical protein
MGMGAGITQQLTYSIAAAKIARHEIPAAIGHQHCTNRLDSNRIDNIGHRLSEHCFPQTVGSPRREMVLSLGDSIAIAGP